MNRYHDPAKFRFGLKQQFTALCVVAVALVLVYALNLISNQQLLSQILKSPMLMPSALSELLAYEKSARTTKPSTRSLKLLVKLQLESNRITTEVYLQPAPDLSTRRAISTKAPILTLPSSMASFSSYRGKQEP